MSKNRPKPLSASLPAASPAERAARAPVRKNREPGRSGFFFRLFISVLLLWHLFALFMAPLSIAPTSQFVSKLVQGTAEKASPMQWYLDALYINHGYSFFAPSPGPGHIVRYRVSDDGGQTIVEGEFPDRDAYWPRLRYHRHFMLSDQAELPFPRRDPQDAQRTALEAYARHLLREHNGSQAQLTRVLHYMLSPNESNDIATLQENLDAEPDPGLKTNIKSEIDRIFDNKYETQMEVTQRRSDLELIESQATSTEPVRGAYNVSNENLWRTR